MMPPSTSRQWDDPAYKPFWEGTTEAFAKANPNVTFKRFAHTQQASELRDPTSFFSGPRFYVNAKLRQLRTLPPSPAVEKSIAALKAVARPEEQHYIGCSPEGRPYRMCICGSSFTTAMPSSPPALTQSSRLRVWK